MYSADHSLGNTVLAQDIPLGERTPEDFMGPSVVNSFALIPITFHEIIQIAKSSKYTRSEGIDGIDSLVGQETIEFIAEIISEIINLFFETGQIPIELKKAKIIPILKQSD